MYIGPFYFDTKEIFEKYPEVKLVYLFGSHAEGKPGPMSDYDFAVYFDEKTSSIKRFNIKINLIADLTEKLKTNYVDVVDLNGDAIPLLKYHVIRYGKLIFERKPYKLILEPIVYSQFFDYKVFSAINNL